MWKAESVLLNGGWCFKKYIFVYKHVQKPPLSNSYEVWWSPYEFFIILYEVYVLPNEAFWSSYDWVITQKFFVNPMTLLVTYYYHILSTIRGLVVTQLSLVVTLWRLVWWSFYLWILVGHAMKIGRRRVKLGDSR